MALYRIPDRYIEGFNKIGRLTDEQVKLIFNELDNSTFGLDSEQIASSLNDKPQFDGFKAKDLKLVIDTILSILRFDVQSEEELNKTAHDLSLSTEKQLEEPDNFDRETLEKHLIVFLKVSGFTKQTVKGRRLLFENEKNFRYSRIVTDLRFVFDDDFEGKKVENAVIIHRLKIEYNQGYEEKEVYFAMDSNDLKDLKEVIDRAIKKEEAIRTGEATKHLTFLSLGENNSQS